MLQARVDIFLQVDEAVFVFVSGNEKGGDVLLAQVLVHLANLRRIDVVVLVDVEGEEVLLVLGASVSGITTLTRLTSVPALSSNRETTRVVREKMKGCVRVTYSADRVSTVAARQRSLYIFCF